MATNKVTYDKNTDYQALINNTSDAKLKAQYQAQRSAKIADMNKTSSTTSSGGNEHYNWIQNTNNGGMDAYIQTQQAKYNQAVQSGDNGMLDRLQADMNRVGYSLNTQSQLAPIQPTASGTQVPTYNPNTQNAGLQSGAEMAKRLGVDYDFNSILNKLNGATNGEYAALNKEYDNTEKRYYDQLAGTQSTALDTIRKSQAQAVATGASRGLQSAQELSSILGLQEEGVANSTLLSQERNLLKDKEAAAYSRNVSDALTTSNTLGLSLGQQSNAIYQSDVEQNSALMGYYAALNEAAQNLAGNKYNADQNLAGSKYTADNNLAGSKYTSDNNLIGNQYSSDKAYQGQIGAAQINANATMRAAATNAASYNKYVGSYGSGGSGTTTDSGLAMVTQIAAAMYDTNDLNEYLGYASIFGQGADEAAIAFKKQQADKIAQSKSTSTNRNNISDPGAPATTGTGTAYPEGSLGNWLSKFKK